MTEPLLVPPGWCLVWWSSTSIRTPCPVCGHFALMVQLSGELRCENCGVEDHAKVQAAFTRIAAANLSERQRDAAVAAEAENHRKIMRKGKS